MRRLTNNEEQQAQHIACSHLVRGCEDAVAELLAAPGANGGRSPATKRAREILAQVLSSWRDALKALRPVEGPGAVATVAGHHLGDWSADELFAEALERRTGDGPTLRLMQGLILTAQLAAHDRALTSSPLVEMRHA